MNKANSFESREIRRLRDLAYERQKGKCYYCEYPMRKDGPHKGLKVTAEHLQTRADGGRTSESNIVAACWCCNQKRAREGLTVHQMRKLRSFERWLKSLKVKPR